MGADRSGADRAGAGRVGGERPGADWRQSLSSAPGRRPAGDLLGAAGPASSLLAPAGEAPPPAPTPPPKYKMAVVTLMAVFPPVLFFNITLIPRLRNVSVVLRTLILCVGVTAVVTYVMMPRLQRLFRRWLNPGTRPDPAVSGTGYGEGVSGGAAGYGEGVSGGGAAYREGVSGHNVAPDESFSAGGAAYREGVPADGAAYRERVSEGSVAYREQYSPAPVEEAATEAFPRFRPAAGVAAVPGPGRTAQSARTTILDPTDPYQRRR